MKVILAASMAAALHGCFGAEAEPPSAARAEPPYRQCQRLPAERSIWTPEELREDRAATRKLYTDCAARLHAVVTAWEQR